MAPASFSFSSASEQLSGPSAGEPKVKLRVWHSGRFTTGPDGKWRYLGDNICESIPITFRYADMMFRLTEKLRGAYSLKYQVPGDELDPIALCSVEDDSDVQEMFDNYFSYLKPANRPGNFRLTAVLFDADEEPLTPEEFADGNNFFRLSSGERVAHAAVQALPFSPVVAISSRGSNASSGSADGSRDAAAQAAAAAAAVEAMHYGERAAKGARDKAAWEQELAENLYRAHTNRSMLNDSLLGLAPGAMVIRARHSASLSHASRGAAGMLYQTQDTWFTCPDATPPGQAPGPFPGRLVVPLKPGQAAQLSQPAFRHSLSSKSDGTPQCTSNNPAPATSNATTPALPPRSLHPPAIGISLLLPSHISAFGDGISGRVAPPASLIVARSSKPSSPVQLPSHISVFGDNLDEDEAEDSGLHELAIGMVGHALQEDILTPPPGLMSMDAAEFQQPDSGAYGRSLPRVASNTSNPMASTVHHVPKEEIKVLQRVGEGAFGEVSLAACTLFGKVAVKWLKPGKVERHSASFWREAELLAGLNHPNVLRFYGAVVESARDPLVVGIMTEYMRGGSLSQFLKSHDRFIPLKLRAELALHAVTGLAYLHEVKVVHFDLKPENLLLEFRIDPQPNGWFVVPAVKVADFGLSKQKAAYYVSGVRDLRGTLPYMAPELVNDPDHVTEKADVWSMGMVLWELLTLESPFQHLTPQQIISGLMVGNLFPQIPSWCEPEWLRLMTACWEVQAAQRPSFRQLSAELERLVECA